MFENGKGPQYLPYFQAQVVASKGNLCIGFVSVYPPLALSSSFLTVSELNLILCRLSSNVVNGSTVLLSIMHGKFFSVYPGMLGHSSIHLIVGGLSRKNLRTKIIHFFYHRF